ncbi:MAG: hypothetical protein AB8G16_11335 [Gammaproteobacteria bacterium]
MDKKRHCYDQKILCTVRGGGASDGYLPYTNGADDLGLTVETVNRSMTKLKNIGLIVILGPTLSRSKIPTE